MMKNQLSSWIARLGLVAALGAAGACGSSERDADLIEFERTGGFAGGTESVRIEEDGTATRTARDGTRTTTTLTTDNVDELHQKLDAADFESLKPSYGDGPIADGYVYTISVRRDGDSHTVQVTEGADYPQQLTPVIIALNKISDGPDDGAP